MRHEPATHKSEGLIGSARQAALILGGADATRRCAERRTRERHL